MERNLTGQLNMMKEMGTKPNFSDVARRYGVDRHTVAKYWNGGGPQPGCVLQTLSCVFCHSEVSAVTT